MAGRKSKAVELGLLKKKAVFLKKLPSLGPGAKEVDVQRFVNALTSGYLTGLLSKAEHEQLQKSASIVLRALRQRHQGGELEELERLVEESGQIRAQAKARATAERSRTR
jgi:hypothetical protein